MIRLWRLRFVQDQLIISVGASGLQEQEQSFLPRPLSLLWPAEPQRRQAALTSFIASKHADLWGCKVPEWWRAGHSWTQLDAAGHSWKCPRKNFFSSSSVLGNKGRWENLFKDLPPLISLTSVSFCAAPSAENQGHQTYWTYISVIMTALHIKIHHLFQKHWFFLVLSNLK